MPSFEMKNFFTASDKEELQIILKNASDSVHILDADGNIVLFSDSFANSLGYTHEETALLNVAQWDTRFSADELKKNIQDLLHNSAIFETQHRRKDGTVFDAEINATGVEIRGEFYLYASSRNISERKSMDAMLLHEKKFIDTIIESANHIIAVIDKNGSMVRLNRYGEEFSGYSQEEIGSEPFFWKLLLPEAIRPKVYSIIEEAKNGNIIRRFENSWISKSGEERIFDWSNTLINDQNGAMEYLITMGVDITQRKKNEEGTKLLASIFSAAHDGIMICNSNENIVDVNPAFSEIVGYTKGEVLGLTPRILSSGMQSKEFYIKMWKSIKQYGFWKGEMWNRNKTGEFYAVQTNISLLRDENGNVTHYIGIFSDITSLKSHEEALDHLAHYDSLTNLPNRALLADRLEMALSHAHRKKSLLAVCFIDLDGFKPINDTYGHEAGDNVLIEIARRIKEEVRADDTIARLGGDEFVILLSDMGDIHNIELTLDRYLMRIRQPIFFAGHRLQVSASIGVTLTSSSADDADILLRQADQAMYAAKQTGRNRFHIFNTPYEAAAYARYNDRISL